MKTEDKRHLMQLIQKREEVAAKLKIAYDCGAHDSHQIKLENQLNNLTWAIKRLIFLPVKTKYYEYESN
jgi:hypothetical protein